ncbi:alpha/beta fold hydrolase [Flaviaesturariibacter flavus]|nr:alpha/beta hydrolase [Flaviaesturariibacter flavus]
MRALLLLHGALGAPAQLHQLAGAFSSRYAVHTPAFPGHAGQASEDLSMEACSRFIGDYIRQQRLEQPLVFGYSMGGYAALHRAAQEPGLIGGIVTLATKMHWTPEGAAREIRMLNPDVMEQKVPAFAEALRTLHAPLNWKEVVHNTAGLMQRLGEKPLLDNTTFAALQLPVLLLVGDRDNMVTLEETAAAARAIPGAQLGVLPATPHPIDKMDNKLLAFLLERFFNQLPFNRS